jgi:hypothetical protein
MATRIVFLSFVHEDLGKVNEFQAEARDENSSLSFDHYLVDAPYSNADAQSARGVIEEKIRAASVLICLVGRDTSRSPRIDWEIRTATDAGIPIIAVRLHWRPADPLPAALTMVPAKVLGWDIPAIVRLIG